ncbi:S1 RNA-binding domain-containing protein [Patescibacteria group bacterium]|nr:MAG: S1 RNA-binding domain-containing protein [Patescibacteria group bacterium]
MSSNQQDIFNKLVEEVDKIKEPEITSAATPVAVADQVDDSPMGQLLAINTIRIPEVGDVVHGTVIDIASSQILLDLGPVGTGVVIGKEIKDGTRMHNKLRVGDVVSATLTSLENEDGNIELSIREASYEKSWDDLESKRDLQETLGIKILDANKGGLMVELNGITGFLPVSQLSNEHYPRVEDGDKTKILALLKKLVSQELSVRVIDVDRAAEKLIVSEKAAVSDRDRKAISQLKPGDVIEGEVSGVVDFGAFVKFFPPALKDSTNEADRLEGLVHISELAWQLIDDPRKIVKTGDKIGAQIIGIDDTRISLSMKALKKDPWTEIGDKYKVGEIVSGKVDKINPFGAFVYLDENIHGLAHVSEFREVYPDKRIEEVLRSGEAYNWKILSIEPREHRMGLMIVKDGETKEAKKEK